MYRCDLIGQSFRSLFSCNCTRNYTDLTAFTLGLFLNKQYMDYKYSLGAFIDVIIVMYCALRTRNLLENKLFSQQKPVSIVEFHVNQ